MHLVTSIILAIIFLAIAYAVARYISLGVNRGVDELEVPIRKILELSDPKLSLMVREIWGRKFLQFRSEIRGEKGRSLELWLPKFGWSDDFYPWVVRKCIEMGLSRAEFTDNEGNEYVVISFNENVSIAARLGTEILVEKFGLLSHDKVKIRIDVHRPN